LIWLFDVNVLIAIADPSHIFHDAIHDWLGTATERTWASCPITENGMVRVLSQSSYRGGTRSPAEAIATLRGMKEARPWRHVFWPDDFSIAETGAGHFAGGRGAILGERIAGTKQVTDAYLASLALRRGGRLVTFDSGIAWEAVAGGNRELIEIPLL
jgi:toxin-antitoxin system PIN domain toxin